MPDLDTTQATSRSKADDVKRTLPQSDVRTPNR